MITRAAFTRKTGHMRPASRVFETPDIEKASYFHKSTPTKNQISLALNPAGGNTNSPRIQNHGKSGGKFIDK